MSSGIYGLMPISGSSTDHAIVVLHGIRQTRDDVTAFAKHMARFAKSASVYVYGYNHTRALEDNGTILAKTLFRELLGRRIDLVGYSMGGLVGRLAATDFNTPVIHTVVTIATPNRGSLSNAELTTLGQIGRNAFQWLSPLAPRTEGVKDLTRAAEIMSKRYEQLLEARNNGGKVPRIRYASIPALYYHPDRSDLAFGPSLQLSGLQAALLLSGLKQRLMRMERPHDGIVTEASNKIVGAQSYHWSEIRFAKSGPNGEPARCHVVLDRCRDDDHGTILNPTDIALLTWSILDCTDWRQLETHSSELLDRVHCEFG